MFKNIKNILPIAVLVLKLATSPAYGMSNPSAEHCNLVGGQYYTQNSTCRVNESEYDGWKFYTGKTGQRDSYCAQQGMITIPKIIPNPYSVDCAVCVDEQGSEIPMYQLIEQDRCRNQKNNLEKAIEKLQTLTRVKKDYSPEKNSIGILQEAVLECERATGLRE